MPLIDEIRAGRYVADDESAGPPAGRVLTLVEAGGRIAAGENVLVTAREILDQAPRLSAPELQAAIEQRPPLTGEARADALLGGLAEHLAADVGAAPPDWALEPGRFLDRFWFVSRVPGFRAIALAQTPVALKRRGILWPARSIARV